MNKSGTSRIRFIMLDAEIPEGDLSQITSAIQNALKPSTTIIQQRLPTQPAASLSTSSLEADPEFESDAIELEDDTLAEVPVARQSRETKPSKPPVPKVLELDLTSGVSFETFATDRAPKSEPDRNLVVLAWFKEHRPDEAVTANHVYTCYRAMKWPSGIADFSWPLRALKKEQLVASTGRGQYAINHLGIARLDKMGPAA